MSAPIPLTLDRIYHGSALEVLRTWPDNFVQTVVTSPPYWGLRDYGVAGQIGLEVTPEAYVKSMVAVFSEVRRVLKDNGTLWVNLGDAYNGYMANQRATSISANNQESRPKFGSGHGRRTAGLSSKDMIGIPWRVAFALQADGWILRRDIIWAKPNPMPESVNDRPTTAHEYIFLFSKRPRYFYDAAAIRERCSESFLNDPRHRTGGTDTNAKQGYEDRGAQNPKGPHRMFGRGPRSEAAGLFPGRASRDENRRRKAPAGWDQGPGAHNGLAGNYATKKRTVRPGVDTKGGGQGEGAMSYPADHRNKRSVWTVPTQPCPDAHFATFPEDLVTPCILAGAPAGGVVLDPFMGAGTTGLVAARHNRRFLGVELNPDYIKIAERRIAPELRQAKLF